MVDGAYVDPVDGIYLRKGPGTGADRDVVETGMDGTLFDPAARSTRSPKCRCR